MDMTVFGILNQNILLRSGLHQIYYHHIKASKMSNIRAIENVEYQDYQRCRKSGLSKILNIRAIRKCRISGLSKILNIWTIEDVEYQGYQKCRISRLSEMSNIKAFKDVNYQRR